MKWLEPIKEHPWILLIGVAVVIIFWQYRGSGSAAPTSNGGVTALTQDPNAVAANAQMTLASDAVAASGAQAAAATNIEASKAAAATSIAQTQGQTYQALAADQVTNMGIQADTYKTLGADQLNAGMLTSAFTTAVSGIETTQAQSKGQPTNPGGFAIQNMFSNLIRSIQGVGPSTITEVAGKNSDGTNKETFLGFTNTPGGAPTITTVDSQAAVAPPQATTNNGIGSYYSNPRASGTVGASGFQLGNVTLFGQLG